MMSNTYHPDFKYSEAMNELIEIREYLERYNMDITELVDIIQELVDKEIPMKPRIQISASMAMDKYFCPNCDNQLTFGKQRRCQGTDYDIPRYNEFGCGQKIDWNE